MVLSILFSLDTTGVRTKFWVRSNVRANIIKHKPNFSMVLYLDAGATELLRRHLCKGLLIFLKSF